MSPAGDGRDDPGREGPTRDSDEFKDGGDRTGTTDDGGSHHPADDDGNGYTDDADPAAGETTAERAEPDRVGDPPTPRSPMNGGTTGSFGGDGADPVGTGDAPSPGEEGEGTFGWREFAFDVVSSVVAVFLVGFLLFAVSGVWPPLVAVESGSMHPHMKTGDLVFVMEEERFHGENAHAGTGVVTARAASGYRKFQQPGDVIVYAPRGNDDRTPIIHRAMFWVRAEENWYARADGEFVGSADDCSELPHCPAPHAGFVTLGDNNELYDQARGGLPPVKPAWVVGTAEVRVPALGWVRLRSGPGSGGGLVLYPRAAGARTDNGTATATSAATPAGGGENGRVTPAAAAG